MSEANGVPDALGEAGRAQVLAQQLQRLQQEIFQVETMQLANGHEASEPVPGVFDRGEPISYEERLKKLRAAAQALFDAYPEMHDAVRSLVA